MSRKALFLVLACVFGIIMFFLIDNYKDSPAKIVLSSAKKSSEAKIEIKSTDVEESAGEILAKEKIAEIKNLEQLRTPDSSVNKNEGTQNVRPEANKEAQSVVKRFIVGKTQQNPGLIIPIIAINYRKEILAEFKEPNLPQKEERIEVTDFDFGSQRNLEGGRIQLQVSYILKRNQEEQEQISEVYDLIRQQGNWAVAKVSK